jgi:hypothetical protein
MTHAGKRLPATAIELAARLLREQDLLPERGYLGG